MLYSMQAFGDYKESLTASALKMRDYKDATDLVGGGTEINVSAEGNEVLRILQETYGEEKVLQWGIGVLDLVQQKKVLQQGMHECSVQSETEEGDELDDSALPCEELVAKWAMRDMWIGKECRCASQGWKPTEQQSREFAEIVSELSHKGTSSCKSLFDLWRQGKGIWLLQQALYSIQKIRRSVDMQEGGDAMNTAVRRLTPL